MLPSVSRERGTVDQAYMMSFDSDDDMMENLAPTNLEFWSLEIPPEKIVQAKVKDVPGMWVAALGHCS